MEKNDYLFLSLNEKTTPLFSIWDHKVSTGAGILVQNEQDS